MENSWLTELTLSTGQGRMRLPGGGQSLLAYDVQGFRNMDTPQHLLVGYDGSALSELALHRAFRMIEHAPFALVHVVAVVDEGAGDYVRLPSGELMTRWAALDSIRLMVAGVTEELRKRHPQARVIAHLRAGEIAESLVDFAYRFHIDQIVVGARGQSVWSETALGSVPEKLLGLTEIPVHIEAPVSSIPPSSRTQIIRWAYVSSIKRIEKSCSAPNKERALA